MTSGRSGGAQARSVRERQAPRAARVPTHEDPTASLRPVIDVQEEQPEEGSASASNPPEPGAAASGSVEQASSSDRPAAAREPPVRYAEHETQTPDLDDWTKFDLKACLRELHTGTAAQQRRLVRKLHLRWWHCGTTTLQRLLKAAGAPSEVLDMVPQIVDTCRICRAWVKPRDTIASSKLVTSFNQEVECDIVFSKHQGEQKKFLMFVDRGVRWTATAEIATKSTEDLLDTIDATWISIFGPMKTLIVDGETGLDDEDSTWFFQVRGITKQTAAVGQHTRIADRRVQILRSSLHKISAQLAADGVAMPFKRVLAEATFVINVISSIGGVSPYVAVFGRAPALLPELGPHGPVNDDRDTNCPIHHSARIRELAIQTITEQTARDRLRVALKTPTKPTGQELEFKVGDSVEYFREPSHRDVSGWRGPATVVDLTRLEHGRVGIRTSTDHVLNCRLQDVRHRLTYLVELDPLTQFEAPLTSYAGKAQELVQQILEEIAHNTTFCLGQMQSTDNTWTESAHNARYRNLLQAALYVAEVVFQMQDVVTVRIAKGVKSLAPKPEYARSLVVWWLSPCDRNIKYHESEDTKVLTASFAGEHWSSVRLVQFLCVPQPHLSVAHENWREQTDSAHAEIPAIGSQLPDRLSTIAEGSEETASVPELNDGERDSAEQVVHQFFGLQTQFSVCPSGLQEAALYLQVEAQDSSIHVAECASSAVEIPSWNDVSTLANNPVELQPIVDILGELNFEQPQTEHDDRILDCDDNGVFAALAVEWPLSKFVEGLPREPLEHETVEIRCYESHMRQAVIERQDDLLTAAEMKAHATECFEAMYRELKTWQDLNCFERRPRLSAPCIIDTRWVFKWKFVDSKRTIRARLTLRGFKEVGANEQSNYSGTATKWSQRLLVSESVQRNWPIASTDISKAFLQGITYKEIAETTGQPERNVAFEVCRRTVPILQQLPGMSDFDPITEILGCVKPGTGTRDAPRSFSMKLRRVTQSFGMKSSLVDPELEYLFENGRLSLLVLKHVDDLKMTGKREVIEKFVHHLSQSFGKLQIHWNTFVFTGIQHTQDPNTFEIELDQNAFIASIKPMAQQEVVTSPGHEKLPEGLRRHFLSLLMTLAYAVQSRPDIAVYIAALQKESQVATFEAARRLNKVLLWAQKHPVKLKYPKLERYPDCLVLVSDSAFKAREQDGLSMRGMVALRMCKEDLTKSGPVRCHVLQCVSKTQRHVTRSTFASELFAATDALDFGLVQVLSLEELTRGPLSWAQAKALQEGPGFETEMALVVDAKSVTAAAIAPVLKAPAENSALVSVAWLREQLRRKILSSLFWSDTRIMIADGLTKGAIPRQALHELMRGHWDLAVRLEKQEPMA